MTHVKWLQDTRCAYHKVVHPGDFYAYEGVEADGKSGYLGPVCGEVAQHRYAEHEHLGFFDLGKAKPWQDNWPASASEAKENPQ